MSIFINREISAVMATVARVRPPWGSAADIKLLPETISLDHSAAIPARFMVCQILN